MCGKLLVVVVFSLLAGASALDASGLPHTPAWYKRHGLESPDEKKLAKKPLALGEHGTKADVTSDMDALDAAVSNVDNLGIGKSTATKSNPIENKSRPKATKKAAAPHKDKKSVSKVVQDTGFGKLGSKELTKTMTPLATHLKEFNGVGDAAEAILDAGDAKAHAIDEEKKVKEIEKVAPAKVTRVVEDPKAPSVDAAASEGLAGAQGIVKDIQHLQEEKKQKTEEDALTKDEEETIKARAAARAEAKKKREEQAEEATPNKVANLDKLEKLSEMADSAQKAQKM